MAAKGKAVKKQEKKDGKEAKKPEKLTKAQ